MPNRRAVPAWRRYLRFWGSDYRQDLDDELRFHIEARYDEYIAMGMSPTEARAETERRFGDVAHVRDRCTEIDSQWARERTMSDLISTVAADLRFGVRQLRRTPSLTIAAVLCFALGIGANTSIFSVVDTVLFRPLPFLQSDRLVMIGEALPKIGGGNFGVISAPEYKDYRRLDGRVFESSAIFQGSAFTLSDDGGEPERVASAAVSATLFDVLRVKAAMGRTFAAGEDVVGGPNVAVLSDALWRRRFNADPKIVGRVVNVNGQPTTIIGVMSPRFAFPLPGLDALPAELFSPLWITPEVEKSRGDNYNTTFIARLAPGVTIENAKAAAQNIANQLPQLYPAVYGANHTTVADVFSLHERAGGGVRRSLLVLLASVGLVLLIACINVSSLLLARSAARHREISVRRALGASRGRLLQQMLAESAALVAAGTVIGVAFAMWASRALAADAPRSALAGYPVSVDARVLAVTLAIAALTVVAVSLVPALQHPDGMLAGSLRDEGRSASGGVARQRARRALVVTEIALAMIVATGAGLMVKSFLNARNVDPGFDPANVATFRLGLVDNRYPSAHDVLDFEQKMAERLRHIPGVQSATVATSVPMGGLWHLTFSLDGQDMTTNPVATNTVVYPDYFRTLRIQIRSGHAFTGKETRETPPEAIINETLAKQFFPGVNPVGKRIKWGTRTSPAPWATIIGVAADVKAAALDSPEEPAVYFSALQIDTALVTMAMRGTAYVFRTDRDPQLVFNAVRRAVKEADPTLPIVGLAPLADVVQQSVATRRFNTTLLSMFAGLGLLLAAIGIYGLMAYAVVQRTREIGIRLAIGASPGTVLRLVVGNGLRIGGVGVAIGVVGSLMLTRLMRAQLFDVSPLDPVTFVAAAVMLLVVAALATTIPARRAARIDPQLAMRAD